jgi:PAS domain S-box-containing protein
MDPEPPSHLAPVARATGDALAGSMVTNEQLATIADAAGIGLWSRELDTGTLFWSAANRALYGLGPSDPLPTWSEYLEHFVHPDDRERFLAEVSLADQLGRPLRYTDFRVRTADGRQRWIYSWATRELRQGRRFGFGVNVDVTDRHVADAERRERERAEQARRAQSALLARVSHELRTPMNAMLGFAELLALDTGQPLSAVQAQRVQHIRAAGRHLLALIDDLLDLAQADADERGPQSRPVALASTVAEAMPWVLALAEQHEVRLEVDDPLAGTVHADPRWLLQVTTNLLTNAVKYNRRGGWVRIGSAARECDRHREWALVVEDSGRGIDATERQRVFEPFERLGTDDQAIAGSGIGLAIVRRLVERMAGEIELTSTPGVGSRFRVWLPADGESPPRAVVAEAAPAPSPSPASLQVLSIEDNAVNRELLRSLFALRPGIVLRQAADGREGLALAHESPPDLVLLDMQLPDMHGHDLLRVLRADPRFAACKIVGLSANAAEEDIREAIAGGCDAYWTKPIDLGRFLHDVDALVAGGAASAKAATSQAA